MLGNLHSTNKPTRTTRGKLSRSLLATAVATCTLSTQASVLMEEVVVTAQKRAENAQDVSVAVTAFSDDQIRTLGVYQPKDIADYTPNLNVKNATGAGNPIFNIRGIGITTFVGNGNPTVGMYVDEVYLPTNILMSFSTLDMQGIEVLKGPQGTLFGRNTTGGAVTFTTNKPTFDPEGYIDINYGNYDRITTEAAFGGGITDTLAGRAAIKKDNQSEGYFDNATTGKTVGQIDTLSMRFSLLWQPSDTFSATGSVHFGYDRSEPWPFDPIGTYDVNSFVADARYPGGGYYGGVFRDQFCTNGLSGTPAQAQGDPSCVDRSGFRDGDGDPFRTTSQVDGTFDNKGHGGVLKLEKDFGNFALVSVTGYEYFDRDQLEDFDGGFNTLAEVFYDSEIEVFTQELRLVSDADADFSWIAGVYFSEDSNETYDVFNTDYRFLGDLAVTYDQDTTSYAAFAHIDWALSEQLSLIGGLRYTYEETSFDGFQDFINSADVTGGGEGDVFGLVPVEGANSPMLGFGGGPIALDDTIDNTEVTGKIGLDWTPTDDSLIYVNYSRGAKSGGYSGFFATIPEEFGPFDPEEIQAWEIGTKNTFLDGRLILNAAYYNYKYEDMQTLGFNLNTFIFTIDNLPEVEADGAEIDLKWNAAEGLDFIAGVGIINEAKVVESVDGFAFPLEGNTLPNSPELTYTLTGRYEWPIANDLMMSALVTGSWKDDMNHQIENRSVTAEESYWLWDARISIAPEDANWDLAIWGKNLADEEYFTETFFAGNAGVSNRLVGAPRTYGIQFRYNFQ